MNTKQKTSLALLSLGLIFSSIIRFYFTVSEGFHFHNFWISLPLPLFDFAGKKSGELVLTSTILGYIFYAAFTLNSISNIRNILRNDIVLFVLSLLTVAAFTFELTSIIKDFSANFTGQHARIGPTIYLLGLWSFIKKYRQYN